MSAKSLSYRMRYASKLKNANEISLIDTSLYSTSIYMALTGNTRLFFNEGLDESVPFGYTGVRSDEHRNYFFVNIEQDNENLTDEEMESAVRNTLVKGACWACYILGSISTEDFTDKMRKLVEGKNERIKNIRKRIQKIKDAASAPQAEVSA